MSDWFDGLEIVDAHHHLWDLEAVHYPWLMAQGVTRFFGDPTPIQKNYLPDDLRRDVGSIPVKQSVHIQVGAAPGSHLLEAQWLQKTHERHGLPTAAVAYCDLENHKRDEMLDALSALPTCRGVRQIVGRHPDEDLAHGTDALLGDPNWLAGLRALAQRGLSFDLQLIPQQMEAAYKVLANVDDLQVALCHCGSPWYRDEPRFALWQAGIKKLASLPNVYCKISGLGMFDRKWTVDSLRPVFDTVVSTFGPGRCMFGSNFPVDKLYASYARLWQAYAQLCDGMSPDERRDMFAETCRRFYSL